MQHLDGNSIAGILSEIFPYEMTASWTTCGSCGAIGQIGTLVVYKQAPGAVVRCPGCGNVQMKIVQSERSIWLDMSGVRALQLPLER